MTWAKIAHIKHWFLRLLYQHKFLAGKNQKSNQDYKQSKTTNYRVQAITSKLWHSSLELELREMAESIQTWIQLDVTKEKHFNEHSSIFASHTWLYFHFISKQPVTTWSVQIWCLYYCFIFSYSGQICVQKILDLNSF